MLNYKAAMTCMIRRKCPAHFHRTTDILFLMGLIALDGTVEEQFSGSRGNFRFMIKLADEPDHRFKIGVNPDCERRTLSADTRADELGKRASSSSYRNILSNRSYPSMPLVLLLLLLLLTLSHSPEPLITATVCLRRRRWRRL